MRVMSSVLPIPPPSPKVVVMRVGRGLPIRWFLNREPKEVGVMSRG